MGGTKQGTGWGAGRIERAGYGGWVGWRRVGGKREGGGQPLQWPVICPVHASIHAEFAFTARHVTLLPGLITVNSSAPTGACSAATAAEHSSRRANQVCLGRRRGTSCSVGPTGRLGAVAMLCCNGHACDTGNKWRLRTNFHGARGIPPVPGLPRGMGREDRMAWFESSWAFCPRTHTPLAAPLLAAPPPLFTVQASVPSRSARSSVCPSTVDTNSCNTSVCHFGSAEMRRNQDCLGQRRSTRHLDPSPASCSTSSMTLY